MHASLDRFDPALHVRRVCALTMAMEKLLHKLNLPVAVGLRLVSRIDPYDEPEIGIPDVTPYLQASGALRLPYTGCERQSTRRVPSRTLIGCAASCVRFMRANAYVVRCNARMARAYILTWSALCCTPRRLENYSRTCQQHAGYQSPGCG